ncbi:MAG: 16S rRNA (cytosine(1402)-N(4))-methyltransferase [Microbacterium sp.]|uniref:16S rRNA (cytosine(1402)-N(4))-methyltransferase RsmH n=2 Tax=unclassified Microbacterium TaxID=2609290 RepID=UPI000C5AF780|nr:MULTISPECIES: 16S rRNA (cytosine(1402)-N(4))-methyltransferase RsmH [unclassified Microbacterium]MAY48743.1 16S rRNA (cytosine(1402)-N(4))-methyltransferase [Microbacterium sp.]HAS32155.1 16S rRNA (cytosine(1402)-N(4))-methyltransferase [Microbacterium sp.]HBR89016.1 16S rRNA (cytosine(1402)-N(4))-methyltransferase [Microbacterium sp.]HBS74714.1 16S rRNA (cytosine(1402)-N(4))-methyltransferase [Microbacterium sp.]
MDAREIHTPVMLDRCVELLAPALQKPGAVLIDGTLGMGGHSEAFLERFPDLHLIGLDRDRDALRIAGGRLERFSDRTTLVHTVYDDVDTALSEAGVDRVDGILYDLGVSSLQLDVADRGFAYAQDAPLDMRMDQSIGVTAADVVGEYGEGDLRRIFERYGEEKLAARYARAIIAARADAPIERSGQLVQILSDATPAAVQRAGHPAKRVFQALRIEVNGELAALERAVPAAMGALAVGGRIVVLSYQSLEDRLIKRAFAEATASTAPAGLPVELPEHAPRFRLLVKGAELASDEERARNSRAIPVRLRAAERVREAR